MALIIRHLSGSHAGQEQRFDNLSITVGRNPSNAIAFDPERDRMVSGLHAEIVKENGAWILRDLGSSNGTYIDSERISERKLRAGDVVQLGKNGPRLEISFAGEDAIEPTVIVPTSNFKTVADATPIPDAPVEGRTVMMMLNQPAGAAASTPPPPAARATRKSRPVVIIALLFAIVALAAVGGLMMLLGSKPEKKETKIAETGPAKSAIPAESRELQQALAQQQANLQQAQQTLAGVEGRPGSGSVADPASPEAEDLRRQVEESQRLIDELTRQLQQRNDDVTAAQRRAPPAPISLRDSASTPQQRRSSSSPTVRDSRLTAVATAAAGRASAEQGRGSSTPAGGGSSAAQQTAAAPAANLSINKALKKKIFINPLPPDIPLEGLPSGTARDLANYIGTALSTSGDYVVDQKGIASVSVTLTNFSSDISGSVNTKAVAQTAKGVGGLFGKRVPTSPAHVQSGAQDASMSARVRVYDPSGRQLADFETAAQSKARKTKVNLKGVPFSGVFGSDTPAGDVARKVVADAVESLRNQLRDVNWAANITSQTKEEVKIDVGRNANIEPDDVFDIVDQGKVIGRIRITSVAEKTSTGQVLTAPKKTKLAGKSVRFAGRETPTSVAEAQVNRQRSVQIRKKTKVYSGPGTSFTSVKELRQGARLRYEYSVGTWVKASDGSGSYWVPGAAAQFSG